jgi:transcriptional regulator NrdR family protein
MKCPFCNKDNTRVIDSRPADEKNSFEEDVSVMNATEDLLHMKRLKRSLLL